MTPKLVNKALSAKSTQIMCLERHKDTANWTRKRVWGVDSVKSKSTVLEEGDFTEKGGDFNWQIPRDQNVPLVRQQYDPLLTIKMHPSPSEVWPPTLDELDPLLELKMHPSSL